MPELAPTAIDGPLDGTQIESFRKHGFIHVAGLIDSQRLAELRSWVDDIQCWPETPGRHWMYFEQTTGEPSRQVLNRVENLMPFHDGIRGLMASRDMRGAVSQLFGEPAVLFKDKINFKLPGGGGFEAHQDVQAGWDRYARLHITAMISIDATTRANGCLELVPGAHTEGLRGDRWRPLLEADFAGEDYVRVETQAGDGVFFDSYAPHRSAPNATNAARRVPYLTYNGASEGEHLERYYADKHASYPPDIEREAGKDYVFRV